MHGATEMLQPSGIRFADKPKKGTSVLDGGCFYAVVLAVVGVAALLMAIFR